MKLGMGEKDSFVEIKREYLQLFVLKLIHFTEEVKFMEENFLHVVDKETITDYYKSLFTESKWLESFFWLSDIKDKKEQEFFNDTLAQMFLAHMAQKGTIQSIIDHANFLGSDYNLSDHTILSVLEDFFTGEMEGMELSCQISPVPKWNRTT